MTRNLFYYKSGFRRKRGNDKRLENGDSAGFADGGNNRLLWLKLFGKPEESDEDIDAMDFHATEV